MNENELGTLRNNGGIVTDTGWLKYSEYNPYKIWILRSNTHFHGREHRVYAEKPENIIVRYDMPRLNTIY